MSFVIYSRKILEPLENLLNFDSNPLTSDHALFPGKIALHITTSNRIFPERREEIKPGF